MFSIAKILLSSAITIKTSSPHSGVNKLLTFPLVSIGAQSQCILEGQCHLILNETHFRGTQQWDTRTQGNNLTQIYF